jgi:hypothetical protein
MSDYAAFDRWFSKNSRTFSERLKVRFETLNGVKRLRIESDSILFQALLWVDNSYDFEAYQLDRESAELIKLQEPDRDFFTDLDLWMKTLKLMK